MTESTKTVSKKASKKLRAKISDHLLGGSVAKTMPLLLAAVASAAPVYAQDNTQDKDNLELEEITVTGIRGSLKKSMNMKRNAKGIVDAINAEDMGKFPDTNLAESLQRISGVSIDRQNGEGSKITVRGLGPDFNLVTLNGRQMPVASIQDTSASSSRSFDFANIASEGISAVEVYKSGVAGLPTGGMGATVNIKTTRPLQSPGMKATLGAKAMFDTSRNSGTSVTPEFSGLYSNTFNDDTIGVALTGSYQDRKLSFNNFNAGWRGSFFGDQNDWGTLPQPGTDGADRHNNRPDATDVYSTTQNVGYGLNDVDRERINGQLTLQFKPVDSVVVTGDYTYSEMSLETRRNDMSVWFNHGVTTSDWTDGPVAGALLYSEDFGASPSDLSFGGARFASKNTNKSFGMNVEWTPTEALRLELDYHNSSAKAAPDSPYGSNSILSTASFTLQSQSVDFSEEFPVISVGQIDGLTSIDPSRIVSTGSSFRNSYMRTEVEQLQAKGSYEFDDGIVTSIDFGAAYTENNVRSAFANVQRDTWGGAGPASDLPDDLFTITSVADKFDNFDGSDSANLIDQWVLWDFDRMVSVVDEVYGACGGNGQCSSTDWDVDRRTKEEQYSAFAQVNSTFDIGSTVVNFNAGLRYEKTEVTSSALSQIPVGTAWVAANEAVLIFAPEKDFTTLEGEYDNWLPSLNLSIEPREDVIIRASYSKTLTRPGFADIQGGQTLNQLFRIGGATGAQGNPDLLPYESKNWDFSGEWYYGEDSYFSVGYFRKTVDNFIGTDVVSGTPFDLPNPFSGPVFDAAVAAVGGDDDLVAIRNWIFANADPSMVEITGVDANGDTTGSIFGVVGQDDTLGFTLTQPVNQRSEKLDGWEFSLQHTFGETGFGVILNYTVVNTDAQFDNQTNWLETQFPLIGVSDSANAVGFYEKNGLSVRVAYNWRDRFLSGIIQGEYAQRLPAYTEEYGQVDVNINYEFTEQLSVSVEGINIFDATQRVHGRHPNTVLFGAQSGPRYNVGVRYKF